MAEMWLVNRGPILIGGENTKNENTGFIEESHTSLFIKTHVYKKDDIVLFLTMQVQVAIFFYRLYTYNIIFII